MTDETQPKLSDKLAAYEAKAQELGYKTERAYGKELGIWLRVYADTENGSISCSAFDANDIIVTASTHSTKPHMLFWLADEAKRMLYRVFDVWQGVPNSPTPAMSPKGTGS